MQRERCVSSPTRVTKFSLPTCPSNNALASRIVEVLPTKPDCSKASYLIEMLVCCSLIVFVFNLIEVVLRLLYSNLMNDF